jgi:hypothetical protein
LIQPINLDQLRSGIGSLIEQANSSEKSPTVFFDFLISHCFKIMQFLRTCDVDINDIQSELKALAISDQKHDIYPAMMAWSRVQQCFLVHSVELM